MIGPRRALERVRRLWREGRTDAVHHWALYQSWRHRLVDEGFSLSAIRVLDLGTGDRVQLALLLSSEGADVTALDLLPVAIGVRRPVYWWRLLRRWGPRSAVRSIVRDTIHTWRYWGTLRVLAKRRLSTKPLRFVEGNAEALPFPDAHFDVVVSSAVWEHLHDVSAAVRELHRVLRPGGLAMVQIALFPGLQGGHHPEWHAGHQGQSRVRPWDHLYGAHLPFPLYLNELTEAEYRAAFSAVFDEVAWEDGPLEGREFLTPERRKQLARYSERDLLLSSVVAWARRPR